MKLAAAFLIMQQFTTALSYLSDGEEEYKYEFHLEQAGVNTRARDKKTDCNYSL